MPDHAADLFRRFQAGPLLLDGAMGTELERHGVALPAPLWSAAALLRAPGTVADIHWDYVAAGADIVVANTFRTNPRTLRRAELLAEGERLNRLAVELARQATACQSRPPGRGIIVAASVGPVEDCYRAELVPNEAELRREHDQMAAWLAAAKPDLLWIETIGTVREARAAAEAAVQHGLPFAISFVVQESGDLLGGEPLEAAVAAIEPLNPLAIGLNCIPPRGLTELLPRLRRATDRPLAAYAHIDNVAALRGWTYSQSVTPAEYADAARCWIALGASIVGGCCGTMPEHIRAAGRQWPTALPS
jgi:S-methylmethionine-dependent homocysteine/selenocysteine methylase